MKIKRNIGRKFYKKEFLVEKNTTLLNFLIENYSEKSRSEIKSYLAHNQILVGGKCVSKFDFELTKGDNVTFLSIGVEPPNPNQKCSIVYEDNDIIVVNKKYGVLSMSTGKADEQTVYSLMRDHVQKRGRDNRVFIVHRLDRDTSGIMLLAKNFEAKEILQSNWQTDIAERKYVAAVEGTVENPNGVIVSYLTESKKSLKVHSSPIDNGGKKAILRYSVAKKTAKHFVLEIELETGRKNQIRVQLASIGHPIVGDKKYGAKTNPLKRVCLHAQTLSFIHPTTKKQMKFEVSPPSNFL